jgi:hypothetical protein
MTAPPGLRAQASATCGPTPGLADSGGVVDATATFPARGRIGRVAGSPRRTVGVIATAEEPTGGRTSRGSGRRLSEQVPGVDRPRRSE